MTRFSAAFVNRMWALHDQPDDAALELSKWRASAWKQITGAGFSGDIAMRLLVDPRSVNQRGLDAVLAEAKQPIAFTAQAVAAFYARRK